MNKFIMIIICLCCTFTSAVAKNEDLSNTVEKSDANIVGHILDKSSKEHLHI